MTSILALELLEYHHEDMLFELTLNALVSKHVVDTFYIENGIEDKALTIGRIIQKELNVVDNRKYKYRRSLRSLGIFIIDFAEDLISRGFSYYLDIDWINL